MRNSSSDASSEEKNEKYSSASRLAMSSMGSKGSWMSCLRAPALGESDSRGVLHPEDEGEDESAGELLPLLLPADR